MRLPDLKSMPPTEQLRLIGRIPQLEGLASVELIEKGWSSDAKFRIRLHSGVNLLIRLADSSEFVRKKSEFEALIQFSKLSVPMSHPIGFGLCEDDALVYTILSWQTGREAEELLPTLSEPEQRRMGESAGEILAQMHTLAAPSEQEEWSSRFWLKTQRKIAMHKSCGITFPGEDLIIASLHENRHLLEGRPQSLQHGDYHVGNMIISESLDLSIIDFNRFDFGDPWEEFNRIVFSAQTSPAFASGQIDGYFQGEPPDLFFRLLSFYIASNAISSIYWAIPFGQKDVDQMLQQTQDVLTWFDGMRNPVPIWYSNSR